MSEATAPPNIDNAMTRRAWPRSANGAIRICEATAAKKDTPAIQPIAPPLRSCASRSSCSSANTIPIEAASVNKPTGIIRLTRVSVKVR